MIRHLSFFFFTLCAAASAEVATFHATESQTTYEAVFNLRFSVEHPFRFVHGMVSLTGGALVADFAQPTKGMSFDVSIDTKYLLTGDKDVDQAIRSTLQAKENPAIEYHSTGVVYSDEAAFPQLRFTFIGNLTIAGVTRVIPMPLVCYLEDKFLQCATELAFPLTAFGIARPQLFGIPSRDRVLIKGDVVFKPKG